MGLPPRSFGWDNKRVGQMGLFSRAALAGMRDRTKARNYSPAAEAFRREHARHREWGLRQRHGRKLMRGRLERGGAQLTTIGTDQACRPSDAPPPAAPPPAAPQPAPAERHL